MQEKDHQPEECTGGEGLKRIDGHSYFALIHVARSQCRTTTLARLPHLGEKAPACYENLGKLLSLLDQVVCCAWGCPGTEAGHLLHRLVGRAVSSGNAGVELLSMGQYDESLTHARSIGEIANLLWLFAINRPAMEHWRSLEPQQRRKEYRPVTVRTKIQDKGQPLLIEAGDYGLLSEHSVHVTPETSPNSVGVEHRPSLGGIYREEMFLLSLNEIARAVSVVSLPSVMLLGPAKDARHVLETARTLIDSVGGARMSQLPKIRKLLAGNDPSAR